MVFSKHEADEEIRKLSTQGFTDFVAAMKNDIVQMQPISEEDRQNCEMICKEASTEYNRSKKEFL